MPPRQSSIWFLRSSGVGKVTGGFAQREGNYWLKVAWNGEQINQPAWPLHAHGTRHAGSSELYVMGMTDEAVV